MNWSEIGRWLDHAGIYWLNFWRLALAYVLGRLWFVLCLTGFLPLLRAALQREAQSRVELRDPSHSAQGMDQPYRPYSAQQLRRRLRRR